MERQLEYGLNDEREPPEINTANKDKNNFVSVMCVELNIFCCDQMSRDSRFGRLTHVTGKVNTIFVEMSIDLQWIYRILSLKKLQIVLESFLFTRLLNSLRPHSFSRSLERAEPF